MILHGRIDLNRLVSVVGIPPVVFIIVGTTVVMFIGPIAAVLIAITYVNYRNTLYLGSVYKAIYLQRNTVYVQKKKP